MESIDIVINIVKEISLVNEPGHDFSHITRVRNLAKKIAGKYSCDLYLLDLLALLHDVEDHKLSSQITVEEILQKAKINGEIKGKIMQILPYISFSKYPKADIDLPIEAKIVIDADRLDAIGAIGVARAFSYGGSHKRNMYGDEESTIEHFNQKLFELYDLLYLDYSKEIAKNRVKFLKEFYDEFIKEINE